MHVIPVQQLTQPRLCPVNFFNILHLYASAPADIAVESKLIVSCGKSQLPQPRRNDPGCLPVHLVPVGPGHALVVQSISEQNFPQINRREQLDCPGPELIVLGGIIGTVIAQQMTVEKVLTQQTLATLCRIPLESCKGDESGRGKFR